MPIKKFSSITEIKIPAESKKYDKYTPWRGRGSNFRFRKKINYHVQQQQRHQEYSVFITTTKK
jgi:hypothetical protein